MSKLRFNITREEHGEEGGEVDASAPIVEEWFANIGATIVGRNMFGGGPGPWGRDPRNGWWGDEPPTITRSSSSPITPATLCQCTAG